MNAIVTNPEQGIDPRELRGVLGCFATGVCVVTTCLLYTSDAADE